MHRGLAVILLPVLVLASCRQPQPTATVPANWQQCTSAGSGFAIRYPPEWAIEKDTERQIVFRVDQCASFAIGLLDSKCGVRPDASGRHILDCLASPISEYVLRNGHTFELQAKCAWQDQRGPAYALESVEIGDTQVPVAFLQVFVPAPYGHMIVATCYQHGAT